MDRLLYGQGGVMRRITFTQDEEELFEQILIKVIRQRISKKLPEDKGKTPDELREIVWEMVRCRFKPNEPPNYGIKALE
jgi:hypothetical protein